MQTMIYRAHQLKAITGNQYQHMMRQVSKKVGAQMNLVMRRIICNKYLSISNVESLLKIIVFFCQRGDFAKENQVELKRVANRTYYNNGKCGKDALDKAKIKQLKGWPSAYKMIFTTNYDCVLDEVLQTDEIKHLHGGFFYKRQDRLKRSSTLSSPDEACLI